MSVPVIVLAAGAATRMGSPKQTLPWHGESLVRRAARCAADAASPAPAVVVTGAHAHAVAAELNGLSMLQTFHPDWADGMASSIRAGLTALSGVAPGDWPAVVIMTCDQPFVDTGLLRALMVHWERTAAAVVATGYAGTAGVPALFSRTLFGELQALQGKGGAKTVIARHASAADVIDFAPAAIDVDSPADYAALPAEPRASASS